MISLKSLTFFEVRPFLLFLFARYPARANGRKKKKQSPENGGISPLLRGKKIRKKTYKRTEEKKSRPRRHWNLILQKTVQGLREGLLIVFYHPFQRCSPVPRRYHGMLPKRSPPNPKFRPKNYQYDSDFIYFFSMVISITNC